MLALKSTLQTFVSLPFSQIFEVRISPSLPWMMKSRKCFLQIFKYEQYKYKCRLTSLHCAVEEKDYKIAMYTSHLIFIASFWCIISFSSAFPTRISSYTVESPNKGHFGTNINQVVCPLYRDCPLLRYSNRIILIGGIKFGDLVVHCREIFNTVSLIRSVPL